MTTINEIYEAINPMPAMLSAKGKVKPEVALHIEANSHLIILLTWIKSGARNDLDRSYHIVTGDTSDEVISKATKLINDLPDAKTARLHDFMGQLGKVIDSGRDLGIDVDYLNPLTETMKRLTENVITHQPAGAA